MDSLCLFVSSVGIIIWRIYHSLLDYHFFKWSLETLSHSKCLYFLYSTHFSATFQRGSGEVNWITSSFTLAHGLISGPFSYLLIAEEWPLLVLPHVDMLLGYIRKVAGQVREASQSAAFLCGLFFNSCLQFDAWIMLPVVPALALVMCYKLNLRWNNPFSPSRCSWSWCLLQQ